MSATSAGAGMGGAEIMPDNLIGSDGHAMTLQPSAEQVQEQGLLSKVASRVSRLLLDVFGHVIHDYCLF